MYNVAIYRRCADLLSQAQHHVTRARRTEDEERVLLEKQQKEREILRMKQLEEEVCNACVCVYI